MFAQLLPTPIPAGMLSQLCVRSGVALAMHHRLSGIATYGLSGLEKEDEHPAYTVQWSMTPLPLTTLVIPTMVPGNALSLVNSKHC